MRALASYILRGKAAAVLVACGFGVLSLMLPPLSWPAAFFSSAALALVVLVKGSKEGMQTAMLALVAMLALTGLAAQVPVLGLAYALLLWLPALLVAEVLRQQRSLAMALTGAMVLAALVLIGIYILVDNPTEWWRVYIGQQVLPLLEKAGLTGPQMPMGEQEIHAIARIMTGTLVSFWLFSLCVTMFLSRWWQAVATGMDAAFREEFYQLRFGTLVSGLALLTVAGAFLTGGLLAELAHNLSLLILLVFLFQGLSVMHQRLGQRQNAKVWLVVMYVLLVLTLPYLLLALVVTGWLDNWVNLRGRRSDRTAN
ncbi:MAG: DUF2232 domain-containing protein [Gammaproteobacteria bacterium]